MKNLLDEYRQKHDKLPKCNLPPEPPKEVPSEWGFYFYEDIGKPLFETAFNPKDLKEQITRARMSSNPTPTGLTYLDPNNVPMLKTTLFFPEIKK